MKEKSHPHADPQGPKATYSLCTKMCFPQAKDSRATEEDARHQPLPAPHTFAYILAQVPTMHILKHMHVPIQDHNKTKTNSSPANCVPLFSEGSFQLFCYLLVWVFRKHGEMTAGLLYCTQTKYGAQPLNPVTSRH